MDARSTQRAALKAQTLEMQLMAQQNANLAHLIDV